MKKCLVLILSVIAAFVAAISLTACGKVDFTVKFSVDGETYASVSTGGSEVIKMPADPQKDGYTFDGWFWDDGVWARPFTANSLLNEPLKSDMTVYAKFSVNHSHTFNKQVAEEKYLKSKATCTAKAVYYYSCECGAASEIKTFEYGDKLPHTFDNQIENEHYLKSAATCTAKAVYYYSCECGEKGEQTFEYGELKDHTFNGTHTCAVCGYYSDAIMYTEISSKNLIVNGNEIKGKVANSQTTFSFINDIEVADGANYAVYSDLACVQPVPSKTIGLIDGDNVCYILVTNGNDINLYTVTVRRRPIYTVAFDTSGGTSIDSQQVEEDSLAAKPADTEKTGYEFKGYDYDFSKPIVENTTINAKWQIITYKISYVLNGGVNNVDNLTLYTIEDKVKLKPASDKLGYTFKSWDNGGVIEKGSTGDKTFTANWQVITYKISYVLNGGINNTDNPTTYTIEDKIELKSAVSNKLGYSFASWDNGGKIEKGSTGDKTFTANYTTDVKLSSDGTTVTGLNNAVSDLVILSEYDGVKVTRIGAYAFRGCTSLTSITIPDSVTSIGDYAFYGCRSLTSITVNANNKNYKSVDGNLYSKDGKTLIQYAIGKTNTLFTIPDCVTSINGYAFYGCTKLTSVTIGDSVTSIGDYAFENCYSLTSVDIPVGVTSIDDFAFSYCSKLTSVNIPDSVTSIGDCAFKDCTSLTSITIGNGVTSIGSSAFYGCSSLTSVTIGNSVTSIGNSAFYGCTSLTSITIPNGVTSIGSSVFYECSKLTSVTIGDGVTSIGDWAFENCKSLTSVTIGDSVTSIGYYAFNGCASLTSITIPDSVTSIGGSAFRDCTSLTIVTIGNGVTSIGNSAFENCSSLTSITIPDSVTWIGCRAFCGCTSLNYNEYDNACYLGNDNNPYFVLIKAKSEGITDCNISEKCKFICDYAFYDCTSLTSIDIPDGVTSIGDEVFNGCSKLTSVTIGDGVTSIGSGVFYECSSLTNVTIGNSVTSIDAYVFENCTSLTSITIGDSVTSIGMSAFKDCTSLTSINVNDNNKAFKSIDGNLYSKDGKTLIQYAIGKTNMLFTIPDCVTRISGYAFYGCTKLTSITIPDGVTSIGGGAFYGCTSLETINYKGTEEQWNSISKDNGWNYGTGSYTINYNYVEN